MRKNAVKYSVQDMTWLSYSETHSSCGYLHRLEQDIISVSVHDGDRQNFCTDWRGALHAQSLTMELSVIDSYWRRENHSVFKVFLLAGFPCSSKWPHIRAHRVSTNCTQWVLKRKMGRRHDGRKVTCLRSDMGRVRGKLGMDRIIFRV